MPLAAAVGIGAVGSIVGGVMQAGAQEDAANQAKAAQDAANATNYRMFQESRGATGSAILPMYAPTGTEAAQLGKALEASNAITAKPAAETMAGYQDIVNKLQPVIDATTGQVIGLYDGSRVAEQLKDLQPVTQARTGVAEANAQAIMAALAAQQNAIKAEEARKGYTGGSSFENNRLLGAAIPAISGAATGRATATLQNAQEVNAVKEGNRNLQLQNINLPYQLAGQQVQMAQMPATALASLTQTSQAPLQFWKLPVGSPTPAGVAPTSVVPSTGGLIASGLGQAAGSIGNYLAYQQLINSMKPDSGGLWGKYDPASKD